MEHTPLDGVVHLCEKPRVSGPSEAHNSSTQTRPRDQWVSSQSTNQLSPCQQSISHHDPRISPGSGKLPCHCVPFYFGSSIESYLMSCIVSAFSGFQCTVWK